MPMMIREILGSIAKWQSKVVLAHVEKKHIEIEKYGITLLHDVALLRNVGIDVKVSYRDGQSESFRQRALQLAIPVHPIGALSDILDLAEEQGVAKVFFLCDSDGIFRRNSRREKSTLVSDMTAKEARGMLDRNEVNGPIGDMLSVAVELCTRSPAERIHFVSGVRRDAFLMEFLYSRGAGTMVYGSMSPYKQIRCPTSEDAADVAQIIRKTVDSSMVEEFILENADSFLVFCVDDCVHAAMMTIAEGDACVVKYLAQSQEFGGREGLEALLRHASDAGKEQGFSELRLDADRAPSLLGIEPWFLSLRFERKGKHRFVKQL